MGLLKSQDKFLVAGLKPGVLLKNGGMAKLVDAIDAAKKWEGFYILCNLGGSLVPKAYNLAQILINNNVIKSRDQA